MHQNCLAVEQQARDRLADARAFARAYAVAEQVRTRDPHTHAVSLFACATLSPSQRRGSSTGLRRTNSIRTQA